MPNSNGFKTYNLRRIRLINFHNFQNETVELKDGGHLFLLGDNGSGKTTLLDAVHYVLTAGNRMDFNSAARVTGKKNEGRKVQGVVMRYNVDTGPMNKEGGVSYAALELEGSQGKPLTIGMGLSAFSMEERIQRWGIIRECALEDIPWTVEQEDVVRVCGQKEMRDILTTSGGFYHIGAYEKELARRLYGNEEVFKETCQFLSMGKAYRELAAGAGDYNQLFKLLLPEPKTDLFERIIESLRSLDESTSLLEEMDKKLTYLRGLENIVSQITACRESMARYRWLSVFFTLQHLEKQAVAQRLKYEELQAEAEVIEAEIRQNRQSQSRLETRILDLQSKDAGGALRQEQEVLREKTDKEAKQAVLKSDTELLANKMAELNRQLASVQTQVVDRAAGLAEKVKDSCLPFSPGSQTMADVLIKIAENPRTDAGSGNPESTWLKEVEMVLEEAAKRRHGLQIEYESLGKEARVLSEEIHQLKSQRELEPGLPGFSRAKAAIAEQGMQASVLYEMLEWNSQLDDSGRASVEELIGQKVLCTFVAKETQRESVGKLLASHFPGLRVQRENSGTTNIPLWIQKAFDLQKSHPTAVSCLAEEMEAAFGPFFHSEKDHKLAIFRSHQTRLIGGPARWVGPEAREKAYLAQMKELQSQLKSIDGKMNDLEREINALDGRIQSVRDLKDFVTKQWHELRDVQVQQRFLFQQREYMRTDMETKAGALEDLKQEIEYLTRRAAGLRETIVREGLEQIEREIEILIEERRSADSAYQSLLKRQGVVQSDLSRLTDEKAQHQQDELRAKEALEVRSAEIRRYRKDVEDIEYYVLRTQKGHQFSTPERVAGALNDAIRKESKLQGGLAEKLGDPAFGSLYGFDYDETQNILIDRRNRDIGELTLEQQHVLEEQRKVVNEKTNTLFKKIIIDEMVAFFARNVARLEGMVRDINRYLDERSFGNIRYRLDVRKLDKYRHFVEAVRKYNPLDSKNEELLRQFIEDNRDEIVYSEVDVIPEVLDYRNWYTYNLKLFTTDNEGVLIDRRTKSVGSGGEQAVPNYLTILTIAHFLFQGNRVRLPALLFDEAFYGIDAGRRDQLLGFADDLGIQLLIASPDQDGVKKEVKSSTTLLVVKDINYDVHLYPFHWENPADEQLELLPEFRRQKTEIRFDRELNSKDSGAQL